MESRFFLLSEKDKRKTSVMIFLSNSVNFIQQINVPGVFNVKSSHNHIMLNWCLLQAQQLFKVVWQEFTSALKFLKASLNNASSTRHEIMNGIQSVFRGKRWGNRYLLIDAILRDLNELWVIRCQLSGAWK